MSGEVRIERDGPIARMVFDHQERRNAITVDMWDAIPNVVQTLQEDSEVRVVIMRGGGSEAFVSGADISEFEKTRTGNAGRDYDALTARAFAALQGLEKPLIASIHGFCIGGGAAIALTADLRYAADDARFSVPPARLGLGYHTAGIQTLIRIVGFSETADLLFTGRRVDAHEARHIGLANEVFAKDSLDASVDELAQMISNNAPLTIRSAKISLQELAKLEAERDTLRINDSIERCYQSEDFKEGVRAFLEKRKPKFRGK
ncbi:MAG: enoyl-CoA hydratase/isomerase family protein [Deltaproteobacteria bacterium]|nr:enoyl-CoA hydratase/isomerase family protein [Deltaproteobacteria bacterium]NND27923.1 enoyl-CoA hydratase [Myxococcales bacterium]MBT8463124.1 enoyl-CoA hydratase/isomerase family protein [Deltaproteobacteria bacterium]MBT8483250.1 enoyl-CoA hydratase/isomerase family protein [Deltaproteobacteria bacterium]NNK08043.1 enoyl-CoA hydratase [Myxococcales bacterium]